MANARASMKRDDRRWLRVHTFFLSLVFSLSHRVRVYERSCVCVFVSRAETTFVHRARAKPRAIELLMSVELRINIHKTTESNNN